MEDLVSIIVPVYNVEQYLDACLCSIVNQTYGNLEIIIVNDGSTDSSGTKCEDWRNKDSRIRVIHEKNIGLSGARNNALDICQGKWITFVDSDDVVDKSYVEVLLELAQKYQVDVAQCESIKLNKKKEFIEIENGVMKSSEFLLSKWFRVSAWGKIYKRKVFESKRYPLGRIHEDLALTYKIIYESEKVAYTNRILYFQNVRDDSITSKSRFYLKRLDALIFRNEQVEYYKSKNEKKLIDRAIRDYAYELLEYHEKTKKILKRPDIAKRIHEEYRKLWGELKKDKEISGKTRITLGICCIIPEFWNITVWK